MEYGESGWSSVQDPDPVVLTKNGWVRGFCRNRNAVFLGIPYAGRCDGAYRFRQAEPVMNWSGVRDCISYGAAAMQNRLDATRVPQQYRKTLEDYNNIFTGGQGFDRTAEPMDENCLYLNVVTPGLDAKARPVVVYLHGGGYLRGSGAEAAAICDRLIDEEDLVIVTVNHRINLFGSLYLGALDRSYSESGIVTQLDLIQALQWVHNNIEFFGGSPERVTLLGESGGGMKIHHLMAMPESRGLFARAIIMSGSLPAATRTKEQGAEETCSVLQRLGLRESEWRKVLELPAEQLLPAIRGLPLVDAESTPFLPTPDGRRMPRAPGKSFTVSPGMERLPLILGSSEEELAISFRQPHLSWEEVRRQLVDGENPMLKVLPGVGDHNVDALIRLFQSSNPEKPPWRLLAQIVTAAHFLGGGSYLAGLAYSRAGAPVWQYSTALATPLPGSADAAASWHGADLPLVFRAVYHHRAEDVSHLMGHSFAAFARTGTPSTGRLNWQPFTPQHPCTMVFDAQPRCVSGLYMEQYRAIAGVSPSFAAMAAQEGST